MRVLDFNATKMRWRPGLRPRPHWGAYSAPPEPLAGFEGEQGKKEKGRGWGGNAVGEGRQWGGRG